ncbi:hypothetical protein H0R35_003199 [Salmonella enterica]|nr:hypothetical protein [Salmonella enterica]
MSQLKSGHVYIDISHNQFGGLSLCVGDDSGGFRIAGDKVGGCEPLIVFEVDAEELIKHIRLHMKPAEVPPKEVVEKE